MLMGFNWLLFIKYKAKMKQFKIETCVSLSTYQQLQRVCPSLHTNNYNVCVPLYIPTITTCVSLSTYQQLQHKTPVIFNSTLRT